MIISLSANNNKVFLTTTSIYIHNLLRLKSLKDNYQQIRLLFLEITMRIFSLTTYTSKALDYFIQL